MQSNVTNQEESNIAEPIRKFNCFVSAPTGTDLSGLLNIIEANNIRVLDPNKFAPGAVQITEKILDGINHADLFIGVLGSVTSNANVMYELGCATALKKQILVITPEESEIPSDLKDLVNIKCDLDNNEAISFALEQILNAPPLEKKARKSLSAKTKPLNQEADRLLDELAELYESYSEKDVANLVGEMLKASGVSIRSKQKYKDIRPDFAVWIDELEPYFGNPILVEVKGYLNSDRVKHTIKQSLHYMSLSKVRAVLVFSSKIPSDVAENIPILPNIYFFDLYQLLQNLREKSLGEIIRDRRNSIVHGIIE